MANILTVLFIPIMGEGQLNYCAGIASALVRDGHKAIVAVTERWKGRLSAHGIQELVLPKGDDESPQPDVKTIAKYMVKAGKIGPKSALDKAAMKGAGGTDRIDAVKRLDQQIAQLLPEIAPDVIVFDQFMSLPSVMRSGIPYVWACGNGTLTLVDDDRAPPPSSGLSAFGDKKLWKEFYEVKRNTTLEPWKQFNAYVVSKGCQPLPKFHFIETTDCLILYAFPLELDYLDIRPLPKNYIRFDNFMRKDIQLKFEIPVPLRDRPGKLVYFSLGSMGAADVDNMKRLVNILSKSKHRFIVSKGPLHDEYSLADNMWGEGSVPQIQVLPLVDLVITHGGLNTVTETFYFGKPMIVLPLFGEQYDNAQRVQDKGFGIRLDAYKCSEEELLNAIEKLLNDTENYEKLQKISQRIQSDNSIAKLAKIIEDYVINRQKYI